MTWKMLMSGVVGAATAGLVMVTGVVEAKDHRASAPAEMTQTHAGLDVQTARYVAGPDFTEVAARLRRAVVSIEVEHDAKLSGMNSGEVPPMFKHFFGPQGEGRMHPRPMPRQGQGSGFFIRDDGLILTNYHVVEDAKNIDVVMLQDDGTETSLEAEVIGTAPEYDIALIKTKKKTKVPAVSMGDSEDLRIGEWVMAVGSPFGLSHSVSLGIVSAKGRREIRPSGRAGVYDFIQTDASINPGNSGGPLVNAKGEVVGINTAVNAAGQGIGFAIPIDLVEEMLPQLQSKGRFARGYLGVKIQPLTDDLAKSFGLDEPHGALVAEVVQGQAADKAGLEEGDIITEFNGEPIRRSSDLPVVAGTLGAGKKAKVKLLRNGRKKSMTLTLGEFPSGEAVASSSPAASGKLGIRLKDLDAKTAERLKLSSTRGALIIDVQRGSVAARAGLREADVVVRVNGKVVADAADLAKTLKSAESGALLRLKVLRDGGAYYMAFKTP